MSDRAPRLAHPISVRLHDGEAPESIFAPVNLEQFTKEVFDGVVGDAHLPFRTLVAAEVGVRHALKSRFRRPLNAVEIVNVELQVALEWNRRKPRAERAS